MPPKQLETATLAGGCFWCLEAVLERLIGVERVVSGYAGGSVPNPTYEDVKKGLGGNLCRCGTYMGIRQAVVDAGKQLKGGRNA